MKYPDGRYLVVRQMEEARIVCDYIEGRVSREDFLARFDPVLAPPIVIMIIQIQTIVPKTLDVLRFAVA